MTQNGAMIAALYAQGYRGTWNDMMFRWAGDLGGTSTDLNLRVMGALRANGGVGTTWNELWRSAMIAAGVPAGSLSGMLKWFWENGGMFTSEMYESGTGAWLATGWSGDFSAPFRFTYTFKLNSLPSGFNGVVQGWSFFGPAIQILDTTGEIRINTNSNLDTGIIAEIGKGYAVDIFSYTGGNGGDFTVRINGLEFTHTLGTATAGVINLLGVANGGANPIDGVVVDLKIYTYNLGWQIAASYPIRDGKAVLTETSGNSTDGTINPEGVGAWVPYDGFAVPPAQGMVNAWHLGSSITEGGGGNDHYSYAFDVDTPSYTTILGRGGQRLDMMAAVNPINGVKLNFEIFCIVFQQRDITFLNGGNDLANGRTAAQMLADLQKIVNVAASESRNLNLLKILPSSKFDSTPVGNPGDAQVQRIAYNEGLVTIADASALTVSDTDFWMSDYANGNTGWLAPAYSIDYPSDNTHLSLAGAQAAGALIDDAIRYATDDNNKPPLVSRFDGSDGTASLHGTAGPPWSNPPTNTLGLNLVRGSNRVMQFVFKVWELPTSGLDVIFGAGTNFRISVDSTGKIWYRSFQNFDNSTVTPLRITEGKWETMLVQVLSGGFTSINVNNKQETVAHGTQAGSELCFSGFNRAAASNGIRAKMDLAAYIEYDVSNGIEPIIAYSFSKSADEADPSSPLGRLERVSEVAANGFNSFVSSNCQYVEWDAGGVLPPPPEVVAALANIPNANTAQKAAVTDFVLGMMDTAGNDMWTLTSQCWVCGVDYDTGITGDSLNSLKGVSGSIRAVALSANVTQNANGWQLGSTVSLTDVVDSVLIPDDPDTISNMIVAAFIDEDLSTGSEPTFIGAGAVTVPQSRIYWNRSAGQYRCVLNQTATNRATFVSPTQQDGVVLQAERRSSTDMRIYLDGVEGNNQVALAVDEVPDTSYKIGRFGEQGNLNNLFEGTIGLSIGGKYTDGTNTWNEAVFSSLVHTLMTAIKIS